MNRSPTCKWNRAASARERFLASKGAIGKAAWKRQQGEWLGTEQLEASSAGSIDEGSTNNLVLGNPGHESSAKPWPAVGAL